LVCCDQACTGTCQACTNALTGNNPDGTCGNIKAGANAPAGQCAPSTCGNDGKCDGNGACEQVANGTACGGGNPTCQNGMLSGGNTCNNGNCSAGTPIPCFPYTCNGNGNACRTTCNGGSQPCANNATCNGGMCLINNGGPCTMGSQCVNGNCVPGDGGMVCQ
jgi:hypothetical protein